MTREVGIIGTGMSRFGKFPHLSIGEIALPAILEALADANVSPREINAAFCGSVLSRGGPGQRILKGAGVGGIPVVNIENACSSGSSAVREACLAIQFGLYDIAVVFGIEKLTVLGGGPLPLDTEDIEASQGAIMPAIYAMRAQRHMADYGTTASQLAGVAVKNHRHGALNPKAQFQNLLSVEEVLASRPVADPLTLLQCCPTGDGAAAVVLAATDVARRRGVPAVKIRGSVLRSGSFAAGFRDMTESDLSVETAQQAYAEAGLGPGDLDVLEVHDAFTIGELMYYEALGLCERGDAGLLLDSGDTAIGGRVPVNPSGGLLAKGHPMGATGVAQIVEIADQLRGRCGARQVEGARIGLTHCTGGGTAGFDHVACSIHILEA